MKSFNNNDSAVRFLLGGIGTGNISLDQNARLCDFELFNVPNKGFRNPYTFFAVRTESLDGDVCAKALESKLAPPFDSGYGSKECDMSGLPRFRRSEMNGNYPFANFKLTDKKMPIEAELEAFTPFIPLETDDSSLPAAVLRYSIKNITEQVLTVSVAGSMSNLCGLIEEKEKDCWYRPRYDAESVNRYVERKECRGIHFTNDSKTETDLDYFEMALLTTEEKQGVSYLDYWHEGFWWDGIQDFWNDFTADGALTSGRKLRGEGHILQNRGITFIPIASLCVKKELAAGETARFEFILSWYRPNRVRDWMQNTLVSEQHPIIRNYYAKFGKPLESAKYLINNLQRLEDMSRRFANALAGGKMPEYVLDAVSTTLTVIRSCTCFRVEDGTFFAWEGCFDNEASCPGNCTHVWNYTQGLAFLFPELERSMRRTEFLFETNDDGHMNFRAGSYLGMPTNETPPAADGQLGTIIRLYRDWKLCGDDEFLKQMWPKAKLALEYAFTYWDTDGDGVMDGTQHNTYDIEFYGVSSMLNSIFYAALRAGEEITAYLCDLDSSHRYAEIREKGSRKLDELTFNGEFYEQKIDDVNKYKYQYGKGCLTDQLLGQQMAHVSKLGYILDREHVKSAVRAIAKYNFREDFSDHFNPARVYALNQNSGLLLCSWPNGGRPEIPMVYGDEVWTGIEYQVASHLIYEGFIDEGLMIVAACRARHDGIERSPWNDVECGHHYARSLASYGVLLALTGFHCDAVNKILSFRPAIHQENFTGFFCCADGWGLYHQKKDESGKLVGAIETLHGDLSRYRVVTE